MIVTALGVGITLRGLAASRGLPQFGQDLAPLAGIVVVAALLGTGLAMLAATLRARSPGLLSQNPASSAVAVPPMAKVWLPPRYRDGHTVSAVPMGTAPLIYDAAGRVAWDRVWGGDDPEHPFCDLALAGGPPHRGTLLEPATADAVAADPAGYARVRAELALGLRLVTGLDVATNTVPGWIGLACDDAEMAAWLALAISAENVAARREGATLFLPAGPSFRLDKEIKNVVTAAAKTHHYWTEHALADNEMLAVYAR